jgi:hypothetical protein
VRTTVTALILVVLAVLAGCAGTTAAPRSSACVVDTGYECQFERSSKAF